MGRAENLHDMLRSMTEVDVYGAREYHNCCGVLSVCRWVPSAASVLLVVLMVMTVQQIQHLGEQIKDF